MLKVLDLFSGIGGFSYGLEMAGGFETVAFCEIDKFAQKVLRKHWPTVPIYEDVRTLKGVDIGAVDVIAGGFPCQDISKAGSGAGLSGERSGLWDEMLRIIDELRPKWVIAENVCALRVNGLARVLQDLWKIGYDAEWHVIPAYGVGAEHRRERVWIIANPNGGGCEAPWITQSVAEMARSKAHQQLPPAEPGCVVGRAGRIPKPGVARIVDDVPDRMDRLAALGNTVVPQIPELLGRAINAFDALRRV